LARGYILYRAQHAEKREQARANDKPTKRLLIDGVEQTFDPAQELRRLKSLCQGLNVDLEPIVERAEREIYDGASRAELDRALAMAARVLIETDP
ncbi:hypothetical protein ABTK64_19805, partial [Acinetobacter baumannii]